MTPALSAVLGGILGPIDWPELLLIFVIVVLIFGGKKLPELARGLGKSIREFKKATNEVDNDASAEVEPEAGDAKNNGASKPGVGVNTPATK
jgi:sec-independent protein translocase protein TatA